MERDEQLANAYVAMAKANHYMLGIVEKITEDERDEAEQILITRQNACTGAELNKLYELALDCLENDRRRARA